MNKGTRIKGFSHQKAGKILILTSFLLLSGCQQNSSPSTLVPTKANTSSTINITTPTPTTPTTPANPDTSADQLVTVTANTPFILNLNQTAKFAAAGQTIRFDSVDSDSRCPTGVACVWAGEAKVKVTVGGFLATTSAPQSLLISTMGQPTQLGGDGGIGYSLQLVDLAPHPDSKSPGKSSAYQATFKLLVDQGGNS